MNKPNTTVTFTVFKSDDSPLSKSYDICDDNIVKTAAAQMSVGTATIVKINFSDFVNTLNQAGHSTAFGYGVFADEVNITKKVVTKRMLPQHSDSISRSKDYFSYQSKPGILMIDYDPDHHCEKILTPSEFMTILIKMLPGLNEAAYLFRDSVSAGVHIKEKPNNIGKGFHLYIPVTNASDIPRFGEILFRRLWLKGYGYIACSANGSQLIRTITDAAVYSPERLDFVGTPILKNKKLVCVEPEIISKNGGYLDTQLTKNLTTIELEKYHYLVEMAKQVTGHKSQKVKQKWLDKKIDTLILNGTKPVQAKKQIEKMINSNNIMTLPTDFDLHFSNIGKVKVHEVLNDPAKFNDQSLADPIEGVSYGTSTAKFWFNNGNPVIKSFAHDGNYYHFEKIDKLKNLPVIQLEAGKKPFIVDECENVLLTHGNLYIYSGMLVRVLSDKSTSNLNTPDPIKIVAIDAVYLTELIMSIVSIVKKNTKGEWVPTNLPIDYANTLLARQSWPFKKLEGIITSPTLRNDGSVLYKNGYDEKSALFLDSTLSLFPAIVNKPNIDDAKKALIVLTDALSTFPFKNKSDLSTMIAALLTSLVRHTVDNAPLFLFNSPKMGSGKGLLIDMISQLATGIQPSVMSQSSDQNEDRKRLMSLLIEGDNVICIDNIERHFESDCLCSILTMPVFKDRLLGKSKMVSASTKATFLATGNNVTVVGDLTRRVLPCNIDPKVEKPNERHFNNHFPSYIRKNRKELVTACLTILRAYHLSGRPNQYLKPFGSFETWSDWVRSAIVWGGLSDPCKGLSLWDQIDPIRADIGAVLESWYALNNTEPSTVSDIIKAAKKNLTHEFSDGDSKSEHENLYNALFNICEKSGALNSRALGHWLTKNLNRIEFGFKFEMAGSQGTRKKYRVKKI